MGRRLSGVGSGRRLLPAIVFMLGASGCARAATHSPASGPLYDRSLRHAWYIDVTHAITPSIPVWHGFGPATFGPRSTRKGMRVRR
jgi:hypothetical protein